MTIAAKYKLPKSRQTGKNFHKLYYSKRSRMQRALVVAYNYRWLLKNCEGKYVGLVITNWSEWCTKMINSQGRKGSKVTKEERKVWRIVQQDIFSKEHVR